MSLPDLSPLEQAVLKFLLRHDTVTESMLHKELGTRQFSDPDICHALVDLEKQGWLRKTSIGEKAGYSILLGRRGPQNLSDINLQRRSTPPALTSVIRMLGELEAPSGTEPAAPARGWIFFVLIVLAIINSFILSTLDVTAVSGFVTELGSKNIPWLWISEMVIGLVFSGSYLGIIDRLGRPLMMKILLGLLAFIYAVVSGLFLLGIPTRVLYPVAYIIYSQQLIIFPIVFWNLSTSLYSMADARRIFPVLASGELIGDLIGYSIFSLPSLMGLKNVETFILGNPALLVGIGTLLLLAGLVLVLFILRGTPESPRSQTREEHNFLMDIRDAYETIQSIPLFRYLFATILLVWLALTILWCQFYSALEKLSSSPGRFSTFYSIFEIGVILVPLILQWVLISRLMRRIPPHYVALGTPLILVASLIVSMAFPLPVVAIGVLFFPVMLNKAWDTPAFQSLQNLIPMDCRGRVSAVLNNYSFAIGIMAGSLLVALMSAVGGRLAWGTGVMQEVDSALGFMAAMGAVAAAWKVRATYEDSMFSWRLTRRRRTDLLDKIE